MTFPIRELRVAGVDVLDCEHKTPKAQEHGYPYIAIPDVLDGRINISSARLISAADMAEWTRRTTPQGGDLLVTRRGRVGDTAPIPAGLPCAIGQNLVLLRSRGEQIDQTYLRWAARSPQWWLEVDRLMNVGAIFSSLNVKDIARIRIPVPPLAEQQAIAGVLSALDDKISANTEAAALAEELIQAHHQKATSSAGTASRPLFDNVEVDFGEPFKGAEFTTPGEGRPLIRIRDLKTFQSKVWTSETRSREVVVLPGDVVVGMDAEFRPTTWLGEAGMLNQRVCRVRGKGLGNAFVREALKAPLSRVERSKSATTVIHLNKSDLEQVELLIPTPPALRTFEEVAERVYGYRVSLSSENRILAATRDALLPQLMSGKLRVRDAEKVLEGVL